MPKYIFWKVFTGRRHVRQASKTSLSLLPPPPVDTAARLPYHPRMNPLAPTMGNLKKVGYTHTDMVDYIIAHPGVKQSELAIRYGYSEGWVSNVMASDAFQSALAARRTELVDPTLTQTIEDRFKGLVRQSLDVLQAKLEKPTVSDAVALKALELGAKSLGFGQERPQVTVTGDSLETLAARLLDLRRQNTIDVTPTERTAV